MKCSEAELLISVEADGEISLPERLALDAHIAACEACRWERQSVHALRDTLSVWNMPAPSDTLAEAFSHRLRQEQERPQSRWAGWLIPRWPTYALGATAAVAAAALVIMVIQHPQAPVTQNSLPQISQNTVEKEHPVVAATPDAPAPVTPPVVAQDSDSASPPAVVQPRVARRPQALRRPSSHTTSAPGRRPIVRRPKPVIVALAPKPESREMNVLAIAPGAATAAIEFAESARIEAENRIAEKALRLRTLMAEADYTVERALISPADGPETPTSVDIRTPGVSI